VPQWGHFTSVRAAFSASCEAFDDPLSGGSAGLDNSASIRLLRIAAFFANAVNLKGVACRNVMMLAADFLFDLSDFLGEKLDRRTAFGADHVVMIAAVVLMLVAGDAVVEGDLAGQSASGEKFQSSVDGGETDARIGLLDQAMQFVDGEVFAGFEERSENGVALSSLFEADATKMLQKNSFCFAHIFARDRRLIVDTLLQHWDRSGLPAMIMRAKGSSP